MWKHHHLWVNNQLFWSAVLCYSVAVSRSKDVASFGPPMPDSGCFFKDAEFVDFLLAKSIPVFCIISSSMTLFYGYLYCVRFMIFWCA